MALTCRQCGYDLRGLRSAICPECGTSTAYARRTGATRGLTLVEFLFDVGGFYLAFALNAALLAVGGILVVLYGRHSWFTMTIVSMPRIILTVQTATLFVVVVLAAWWHSVWGETSMESYRVQKALLGVLGIATVFHAVGVASLVW